MNSKRTIKCLRNQDQGNTKPKKYIIDHSFETNCYTYITQFDGRGFAPYRVCILV
uniref:Uncharacterized protein n=1 Tax=Lepeophtheirus salmonis TaxID=72036 RepID=A0A0K2TKX9_LEPSM